jgi:hypothetical protein
MGWTAGRRTGGLAARPEWWVVAAFGAYFCTYGFRKPFTAASFAGPTFAGAGAKAVLVTSQTLGYALSKLIGVKVVSEATPGRRAALLIGLIGFAQAALLLFGLVPFPYSAVCLFLNGLPLGMVFGLVLGFLEGRRLTEALTAGLCASFILAGGVTKSVGTFLLERGVSEAWMPFAAGLVFAPPLLLFVWMLTRVPPPTDADIVSRSERLPMGRGERRRFFARHALGLTPLLLAFVLITVLRSLRDDFAPEIWKGLGDPAAADVFTRSETLVALGVMAACGLGVLIHNNRRAFFAALGIGLAGAVLAGVALAARAAGWIEPFAFMVLLGLGLYLPYVVIHTTVFERLIALTRDRGNIAYLITLADTCGYFATVAVLLGLGKPDAAAFVGFFLTSAWVIAVSIFVLLGLCWLAFAVRPHQEAA